MKLRNALALMVVAGVAFTWANAQSGYSDDDTSLLLAQAEKKADAKEEQDDAEKPEPRTVRRRVPNYYGQVGLSRKQKEEIYGLQEEYGEKIDALLIQVEKLTAERDEAIHNVLTEDQQAKLKELLDEAEKRRNSRKKKSASKSAE